MLIFQFEVLDELARIVDHAIVLICYLTEFKTNLNLLWGDVLHIS